jgi:hypothetical protein
MPHPSKPDDLRASLGRDLQDEAARASWLIVGLFALAVIGLAFSALTSPRADRTAVAVNGSGAAPTFAVPPVLDDETMGQAGQPAR